MKSVLSFDAHTVIHRTSLFQIPNAVGDVRWQNLARHSPRTFTEGGGVKRSWKRVSPLFSMIISFLYKADLEKTGRSSNHFNLTSFILHGSSGGFTLLQGH